jgi:hypothetical protein
MHYVNANYDPKVVRFVDKNNIAGNIFSPWEWEGYLRWHCPSLEPFIGGRAQQVYDAKTFMRFLYVSGADVPYYHGQAPEDVLDSIDAHLFLTANGPGEEDAIFTVLNSGNWAIVYSDSRYILFADTNREATAGIVRRFRESKLLFEDPATLALSRASFLLSRPKEWDRRKIIESFTEAFNLEPAWSWGYKMLFDTFSRDRRMTSAIIGLFRNRLDRLENERARGPGEEDALLCRMYIASALYRFASDSGAGSEAAEFREANENARKAYEKLGKRWQLMVIR